jgi:TRAP transporter TAXI family solute receptor
MSETREDPAPKRPRRKRKNYSLLILAAGLLLFGVAAGALSYFLRPVTLTIAVAPPGSDDQKLIQGLAQAFARDQSPVRLSPVATENAADSITALTSSKVDMAVARADLNLPANADAVAILRKNVVVLWAPSGLRAKGARRPPTPKIKSIDDLDGHRIGVIGRSDANVTLLRVILSESGVNADKVAVSQFAVNQITEMARDTTLDAYMAVGPLDSKVTAGAIAATATARGEPKFLPIDVSEAIAAKHPLYESAEIAGSIFSSSPAWPDDKIETVSVDHLIIALHSFSDTAIGAFVRQLFNVRQQLAREVPAAANIEKPDTDKDAALPAHPGAAAYIDGTERTFMDKYSDYIWFAILGLSGLGSVGAWLRHAWRRDERDRYLDHRDSLLELITRVRQAETPEALAKMQSDADGVLREALDCYDDGAIEEGDLSAIGLALDQLHHAVADRRAMLGVTTPDAPRMRDTLPPLPVLTGRGSG